MKNDKEKVKAILQKKGILLIYNNLNKIYTETKDLDLKLQLKPVIEHLAIPLANTKLTKKQLLTLGSLDLSKQPYNVLLEYLQS
ncbi:MAG TPA: hypothetical protein VHO70_12080 [Chitinispirillaceae bacterium]|nr:hypothetical protein [Chitinispirillaceae bacterium]